MIHKRVNFSGVKTPFILFLVDILRELLIHLNKYPYVLIALKKEYLECWADLYFNNGHENIVYGEANVVFDTIQNVILQCLEDIKIYANQEPNPEIEEVINLLKVWNGTEPSNEFHGLNHLVNEKYRDE